MQGTVVDMAVEEVFRASLRAPRSLFVSPCVHHIERNEDLGDRWAWAVLHPPCVSFGLGFLNYKVRCKQPWMMAVGFNLAPWHCISRLGVTTRRLFDLHCFCLGLRRSFRAFYNLSEMIFKPELPTGKESASQCRRCRRSGDVDLIPGPGRSLREGNGNTLQYSCLENPIDRGVWKATVHGIAKSWTWLSYRVLKKVFKPHRHFKPQAFFPTCCIINMMETIGTDEYLFCRLGMNFLLPVHASELCMQCQWLGSCISESGWYKLSLVKLCEEDFSPSHPGSAAPPGALGITRDRGCAEPRSHRGLMAHCLRVCHKLWMPLAQFFLEFMIKLASCYDSVIQH